MIRNKESLKSAHTANKFELIQYQIHERNLKFAQNSCECGDGRVDDDAKSTNVQVRIGENFRPQFFYQHEFLLWQSHGRLCDQTIEANIKMILPLLPSIRLFRGSDFLYSSCPEDE